MKKFCPLLLGAALLLFVAAQVVIIPRAFAEEGEAASSGGEGKSDSKKKGGDDDVTGGRFAGDPIYVHLAPLILPVINENGVEQIVTIILDIQVKDFDTAEKLHANMPRVMDSLMRNLYGGLGQGALRNGKLVNVGKVKSKAVAAVSEIVDQDKIQDVLVQGVSQRML